MAIRVLKNGERRFLAFLVELSLWTPEEGCRTGYVQSKESWVRFVGLPIHIWLSKVVRRLGDVCGGFASVDRKTKTMEDFQWVRRLVKVKDWNLLCDLKMSMGCGASACIL